MTVLSPKESALALIQALVDIRPKLDAAGKALVDLYGDFAGQPIAVPDELHEPMVALLDAVLDDHGLAAYFLHECLGMKDGGKIIEPGGREWRLKTVADLRAYLGRGG